MRVGRYQSNRQFDAAIVNRFTPVGLPKYIASSLFACIALALPAQAMNYCSIPSRCASIVIDADSGEILKSHEADKQVYPASLTKVMTLHLLFEALDAGRFNLSSQLPISYNAAAQQPSKIGLNPGQSISVEDAIEAIAVKSANDIAVAVAEAVGGSEEAFVQKMNAKAMELGMYQTTFRNPSGLPNEQQRTTARDMATLAKKTLAAFPSRRHYFGLPVAQVAGRTIHGHNRLLKRNECTGGKTGYIQASGFNLVAWKEYSNQMVIGAVFGGDSIASRDKHMAQLLRGDFEAIDPPATWASYKTRNQNGQSRRHPLPLMAAHTGRHSSKAASRKHGQPNGKGPLMLAGKPAYPDRHARLAQKASRPTTATKATQQHASPTLARIRKPAQDTSVIRASTVVAKQRRTQKPYSG